MVTMQFFKTELFFKMFLRSMPLFLKYVSTQTMSTKPIILNSTAVISLKHYNPAGFEPGPAVPPEADAMSTTMAILTSKLFVSSHLSSVLRCLIEIRKVLRYSLWQTG
jgi:hypothetical protein